MTISIFHLEGIKIRLLLHVCCGPCSLYPATLLKSLNINFEGFFYNPNIHPIKEYEIRRENALIAAENHGFSLHVENEYLEDLWANYENTQPCRCEMCYKKRLSKVAQYAIANNYDSFTTTLLVSPYQNHELIINQSELIAREYNLTFFYKDFRLGFREGQSTAKEMGLYRQKYCGCIKSLPQR